MQFYADTVVPSIKEKTRRKCGQSINSVMIELPALRWDSLCRNSKKTNVIKDEVFGVHPSKNIPHTSGKEFTEFPLEGCDSQLYHIS